MYNRYLMLLLFMIFFGSSAAWGYWAADGEWTPDDPCPKKILSVEDVKIILIRHDEWLKQEPNGRRAVLCETNLSGMGDIFIKKNLAHANLSHAILRSLNLTDTNLSNASLHGADLTNAELINTELNEADLVNAIMTDAKYEPVSTPNARNFGNIKGLKTLWSDKNRYAGLSELRAALKVSGLRELEREVTYALEKSKTNNLLPIHRFIKRLFFEWTTGYGLYPERALIFLTYLFLFCALTYLILICKNTEDGIWKEWPDDRIRRDIGHKPERLHISLWSKRYLPILNAIGYSLQFSLISAFHIGWRDFNVGSWISRMKPREYILRATGSARFISGMQSLISIYLFVIWFLTTFTRPFE